MPRCGLVVLLLHSALSQREMASSPEIRTLMPPCDYQQNQHSAQACFEPQRELMRVVALSAVATYRLAIHITQVIAKISFADRASGRVYYPGEVPRSASGGLSLT